ncbi:hypothetical protein BCS85_05400 [Vibrio splendidus]|nr:hypothetical protein BCU34_13900 [Vibrio sp. 10N.286.45.E10]PMP34833.1 hypothetical protein BCS88_09835 [Vibrio splendidus]PMP51293.1 hypothetical protein BCS85_05400 [Vibrio splendidus]|tara:strand:- start:598 stop:795 length:198 start_codon:yes stop_codon:yes gene_type:complete
MPPLNVHLSLDEKVLFIPSETVNDGEKHNTRSTMSLCNNLDAILAASTVLPAPGVAWQKKWEQLD